MKKKVKKFALVLVFLIPLLYFTFTVLFFSPLEEEFGPVEYIVPREVDFFINKYDLAGDFAPFPVPKVYLDLKVNRDWRSFSESEFFQRIIEGRSIEEIFADTQQKIKDLPFDPLEDLIGEQVSVAGTFTSNGTLESFLLFCRGTWKAKFYFELMTWNIIRGFFPDPRLSESSLEFDPRGFMALTLSDGRTFYLKRCADVMIIGNDDELMMQVADLVSLGKDSIDLSLGGSHQYYEKVTKVDHESREIVDFHINLESFFSHMAFDDAWRENQVDFSVMTVMDIFDPAFFLDVTGTLDLSESVRIDTRTEFNKQNVQEAKTGLFDLDSIKIRENMAELANMLPSDIFLAGCVRLDILEFLQTIESNLEPELRTLINDMVREGGRYSIDWKMSGTWEFIDFLDKTFGQKVFFALRSRNRDDKPLEPYEQPLPIIALIFEIADPKRVKLLDDIVVNLQNNRRRGFDVSKLEKDWYSCEIKIIDPKGVEDVESITFTQMGSKYFVLCTSLDFVVDIVQSWGRPEERLKLTGDPLYQRSSKAFSDYGNLAMFVNVDGLRNTLEEYARFWAFLKCDQTPEAVKQERERVRARLLNGGRYKGRENDLAGEELERFEELVDSEMDRIIQQRYEEQVPVLMHEFKTNCTWLNLLKSVAFTVNINTHDMDIITRLETILEKR